MTGQQEKDASELLERIEKSSVLKASATSDRALRLLDGGIDVPECINEVLLEHQKQRLCQLELQFRLLGTWNSCYLLDPRVELKLGLTAAQIPEITQLTEKADEKRAAARKAAETEIKEIRATALRDATAGLSAAQRKLLARLIGHW